MVGADRLSEHASRLAAEVATRLPSAPLVLALSGGADSAVACWAVARWAEEGTRRVRAVSVDHGLEGSRALMDAAAAIAGAVGLAHVVVAAEPVGRSETELRRVRWETPEPGRREPGLGPRRRPKRLPWRGLSL